MGSATIPTINYFQLKRDLDNLLSIYYNSSFIDNDPISIPHRFELKQDIEIAAFLTAIISWGNRKSIINSATILIDRMDNAPYQFIKNYNSSDFKKLVTIKHRTFNADDLCGFLAVLQKHFKSSETLETAFLPQGQDFCSIKWCLENFHDYFFHDESLIMARSKKHISTPKKKSSCKRLNMFLRWMVRPNDSGIDFGIWHRIPKSNLMIPMDVHVFNKSKQLRIINNEKPNWQAVEDLTNVLRVLDADDPIKYDYALFSLGVNKQD